LFAVAATFAIQVQVAIIYLDACIAKLQVPEWANGTHLYYDMMSNYYGPAHLVADALTWFITSPAIVFLTWSVLVLEFCLGINLVLPPSGRRIVLYMGLLFHAGIAMFLGLITFGVIMMAAILVGVSPVGWDLIKVFEPTIRATLRCRRWFGFNGGAQVPGTEQISGSA